MATIFRTKEEQAQAPALEFLALTHRKARTAWAILLIAAVGFVAAGSYAVYRGFDARSQVREQLVSERITTADDAAIPGVLVQDAQTAMVQADIIREHALNLTDGKTYAEMDREDPLRQTALNGALLRGSLMSAALAWSVAELVIGIGAFIVAIGVLMLVGLALIRPTPHHA